MHSCCFRASCTLCKPDARCRLLSGVAATGLLVPSLISAGEVGLGKPKLCSSQVLFPWQHSCPCQGTEAAQDTCFSSTSQSSPRWDPSEPDATVQPLPRGKDAFRERECKAQLERNVRWPKEITASHLLLQSPRQAGVMRCLPLFPKPGFAYEK